MIALVEFHSTVLVYSANVTNNGYDKPHISFQTTNRFYLYFHKKFYHWNHFDFIKIYFNGNKSQLKLNM